MFYTKTPDQNFSLFQVVYQKIKVLQEMKFNQEILTKLLTGMQQLSINLLCSSECQTTYSFCEIKHFFKQAKSLLIYFQELRLKNIVILLYYFSCLETSLNYTFYRCDLSFLEKDIGAVLWE